MRCFLLVVIAHMLGRAGDTLTERNRLLSVGVGDSPLVTAHGFWLNSSMVSFSERHGYKPTRSRLHQLEEMDPRLRNAIWNFLLERYFVKKYVNQVYAMVKSVWTEVVGRRSDEVPSNDDSTFTYSPLPPIDFLRVWYLRASWNEVYDVLEHLLRKRRVKEDTSDANAMLSREGSAYRFVGDVIVPITDSEELAVVEAVAQLSGPFHGASQHITQAVTLLSDRDNPDFRNAIKESISAVESAVQVAVGDPKVDINKGLQNLEGHPQLKQAWNNMYNWTSDEDGVRHGIKGEPQVGLPEARYMVVVSSAFVNYLVVKSSEINGQ